MWRSELTPTACPRLWRRFTVSRETVSWKAVGLHRSFSCLSDKEVVPPEVVVHKSPIKPTAGRRQPLHFSGLDQCAILARRVILARGGKGSRPTCYSAP